MYNFNSGNVSDATNLLYILLEFVCKTLQNIIPHSVCPLFFHDSNLSGPLINRIKRFRNRFRFCIYKNKNRKLLLLGTPTFFYFKIFSPIIDVFTHKRFLSDCSFKSSKVFDSDSAVCTKQPSPMQPDSALLGIPRWDSQKTLS